MTEEFQIHDYALAYAIRDWIYYYDGPASPHESDRFAKLTGKDLLSEWTFTNVEKVSEKFPWVVPFLNKCMAELWNELPEMEGVTAELSNEDNIITYFIDGKAAISIVREHLSS